MRIVIAAVGRLKSGPEAELVAHYLALAGKIGRGLGFQEIALAQVEAPGRWVGEAKSQKEGELLLAAAPPQARRIALDPDGDLVSSEAFAALLARWRDDGAGAAAIFIGGADGFPHEVKNACDRRIAYGRATFPHLLVRAMLAEQIFRAMTILSGHPYHRA